MPHALTFSCDHRFKFLDQDRTRQWFVEALQAERLKWPIDLWAWVIMPEHVHLIVAPREPGVSVRRGGPDVALNVWVTLEQEGWPE